MMRILTRYLYRQYIGLFLFCVVGVVMLFVIVDLVEHMDKFIDKGLSAGIVLQYYYYYVPSILVLILPVATLLATVFSVGNMASRNEILALKALGYSLYQMLVVLLPLGVIVAALSFWVAEVWVAETAENRLAIEREHLGSGDQVKASRLVNLEIREGDRLITLGRFNPVNHVATRVKIEQLRGGRLVARTDADSMWYRGDQWVIWKGVERQFFGDDERVRKIADTLSVALSLSPKELMRAQGNPEDMGYFDLKRYVEIMRRSGGEVYGFLTQLHLRVSFPISNVIIIIFSLPLAYNRRKKSVAIGFGISLAVCFFYFGLVKLGQAFGENGHLPPLLAAWMGNGVMAVGSAVNLVKTRK